jgi:uncharacterized protein
MNLKKKLWFSLGILLLGIAYIGVVTPGIPWSTPTVGAAYCFAKSSDRMHRWLYNHKLFGPFLINWQEKKVFPTKMKYVMLLTMSSSLAILWFTTYNINAVLWSGVFMAAVAYWAWRFPGTVEEHERRIKAGKKIGWLK